jgi:hypothetical protein
MVMIAAVLLYNVGTIRSHSFALWAGRYAKLTDWLVANDALRGYSDYDTAYVVQFESNEKALISPTLFHPTFCDRWPEYTKVVRSSGNVCYIIDGRTYPGLVELFERNLTGLSQQYKKDRIGDFTVYRGIAPEVHPEETTIGMPSRERQ